MTSSKTFSKTLFNNISSNISRSFPGNVVNNVSKATLLSSSSLVGLALVAFPGEAATFASSNSSFLFGNFSQAPDSVAAAADSDTTTISSGDGIAIAEADASALFSQATPAFSLNTTVSEALGAGSNYLGLAESEASVLGQFDVVSNSIFAFDFIGSLALSTAVDEPDTEQAQAAAGITFALLDDSATVLSSFELFGSLDTPGDNDALLVDATTNLDWTVNDFAFSVGVTEPEEAASITVSGGYSEWFTTPQRLTLVEFKASDAFVSQAPVEQTPEPGMVLAVVSLGGVAARFSKRGKSQTAVKS